MWTAETWKTEEDVERDIIQLAEYNIPTPEQLDSTKNPVPDTILQYRRLMARNREKVLNADIDESATYIVSGRGKGIRDRIIRPGGVVEYHPLDDIELKKQIREVSGFGYSNELIEESIKARSCCPENSRDHNFQFKLMSSSSSTSSDKSSSTLQTKD